MSSKTAKDLVPGNPEEIWLLADSYNRMAHLCEEVGHGFRKIDVGTWCGRAAEAFHARFERQPKRFMLLADCYLDAAVALDVYAAALAWAQRQAGELIALGDGDEPSPAAEPIHPALTVCEQAELTGVITGTDQPEPKPVHIDQRGLALDMYRRALAMLQTVGNESATAIKAATELMPAPLPGPPTITVNTSTLPRTPSDASSLANLAVRAVLPAPATRAEVDPLALRDDLQDWSVAIKDIRKRLRGDSLNRLSPRLARHIFEGHYRPNEEKYTGYHHREGGVDQGALRVVNVLQGPDQYGIYKAELRGPHTRSTKTKVSTFFPDSWSRAEVRYAVRHVFLEAMRNKETNYDPADRRFEGVYKGVAIVGYVKRGAVEPKLCDIETAYPRGVWKRKR